MVIGQRSGDAGATKLLPVAKHFATTVGATATVIAGTQYPGWVLHNPTGGATVYLGDSTVTDTTGFPLATGTEFRPEEISYRQLQGLDSDRLYGIVTTGTQVVHVLVPGRTVR